MALDVLDGLLLPYVLPKNSIAMSDAIEMLTKSFNSFFGWEECLKLCLLPSILLFFEAGQYFEVVLCEVAETFKKAWDLVIFFLEFLFGG